jgi:hypothetical protein
MKRLNICLLSKALKMALLVASANVFAAEETNSSKADNPKNYLNRYTVNVEQGTVVDKVTGLMWDRCYYGLSDAGCGNQSKEAAALTGLALSNKPSENGIAEQEELASIEVTNSKKHEQFDDRIWSVKPGQHITLVSQPE